MLSKWLAHTVTFLHNFFVVVCPPPHTHTHTIHPGSASWPQCHSVAGQQGNPNKVAAGNWGTKHNHAYESGKSRMCVVRVVPFVEGLPCLCFLNLHVMKVMPGKQGTCLCEGGDKHRTGQYHLHPGACLYRTNLLLWLILVTCETLVIQMSKLFLVVFKKRP